MEIGQHNRAPGTADGPGLHEFEARTASDELKRDLELIHVPCGEHVCDVESSGTLGVLSLMAIEHFKHCPKVRKGEAL